MSKLRILSDNKIINADQVTASIYKYQRLFYNNITGVWAVNDTITGSVTGETTGIIKTLGTLNPTLSLTNYAAYSDIFTSWTAGGSPTFDKTKPDPSGTNNGTQINVAATTDYVQQTLTSYLNDLLCFSVYVAPNTTNDTGSITLEIIDAAGPTTLVTATFDLTATTTTISGAGIANAGVLEEIDISTDYHYRRIYIYTTAALGKNIICKIYPTTVDLAQDSIFFEASVNNSITPLTAIKNTTVSPKTENYSNYMDILLTSYQNAYYPSPHIKLSEVISSGAKLATTIVGNSILCNHHDFPVSNLTNYNRNKILPAKNNIQTTPYNFKTLRITTSFETAQDVSCIAILNHNLSDTATIEVHLIDSSETEIYTEEITNPNVNQFNNTSDYYIKNGSLTATATDRDNIYKNNNIFILYLPGTYNIEQLEIDITDNNNTNDFIFVGGGLFAGTFYEVSTNFLDGWNVLLNDLSTTTYALSPMSVEREQYNSLSLNFNNIDRDELTFWRDLYKRKGTTKDFIIDLFNGSSDLSEGYFTFYGRFESPQFGMTNSFLDKHSLQLQFRESI